jgi:hypothetical protein
MWSYIGATEVSFKEFRPVEIGLDVVIFDPPLIPDLDALL